jgi:arylsulfatase A-like enzyme
MTTQTPRKKLNVLVFLTDQQRWDTVGAHGNPLKLTPNFDRLAESGTFVRNSFTCHPICGPARSVFQTGRFPTETGCFRNGVPLPKEIPTLANAFAEAGYVTGYIGKWHLSEREPVPPEDRAGYQEWLAANLLEFVSGPFEARLFDEKGQEVQLPGYRVDALADAGIRFIDGHREALGGSTDEHLPGYLGMVQRLDEAFGRVVEALQSLSLLEDTIILFSSDHGCHFKTRNDEYKRSCHEASVRVPTLLHGPRFENVGAFDGLVSLIDLPVTLLDAADIAVPKGMRGRSVAAVIEGREEEADDVFIQISEHHVGRALRTRRWKYEIEAPHLDGYAVVGSDLYVEARLYDLEADPDELHNVVQAPEHRAARAALRAQLLEHMREIGEPEPRVVTVESSDWQHRMEERAEQRTILAVFEPADE